MVQIWRKVLLGTGCFLAVIVNLFAQPKNNSPYTRFGLGDLIDQHFVAPASLGRIGATFNDPYHANVVNPASLGYLKSTALEGGVFVEAINLKDNNSGQRVNLTNGNLSYLSLSFPLFSPINQAVEEKNTPVTWGMNFSLMPFTTVNYDITSIEAGNLPEIDAIEYVYQGEGGTYKVNWGNGITYKNFSFGANLQYFFGKINRYHEERLLDLDEEGMFSLIEAGQLNIDPSKVDNIEEDGLTQLSSDELSQLDEAGLFSLDNAYRNIFEDDFSVSGFHWSVGAMYKLYLERQDESESRIKPRKSLTLGVYGNGPLPFRTNTNRFDRKVNLAYSVFSLAVDTLAFSDEVKGDGQLPSVLGLGLLYDNGRTFKLGGNVELGQWGDSYENDAKPETLNNTIEVGVGTEWTPDPSSYNNYLKRMRYRLAAFYETDPRSLNGEQLSGFGGSIGVGLPIILKQDVAFIDFKVDVGQFGLDSSLQQNFIRFSLGFTLNDNSWFYKRKFR